MTEPVEERGTEVEEQPPTPQVAVVVPTYNEAENLPELVERLFATGIPNTRLIVVDDNSPDGTGEVALKLASQFGGRIELVQRAGKQGLGTAYIAGFKHALEGGADLVFQMDADLSHPPEYLPALMDRLGMADVVVGSRYVRNGGADESWSLTRRLLSSLGNSGIRLVAGLKVRDATSGFKGLRASALRTLDMTKFRCKGFAFQAEITHACQQMGYRIVEHPIVFTDRARGRSKMSPFIVFEALWKLLPLRLRRQ